MITVIFVAVETAPIDRFELGEEAVVADFLRLLEGRGVDVTELVIFKEDHEVPLKHHHPLHGHEHPVFHAHRAHRVQVTVHYQTRTFDQEFAPSTTIAALIRWAVDKAGLGKEEAEEHVLQIHGSRVQPQPNAHLGSVVTGECKASFDLVRKKLVQG